MKGVILAGGFGTRMKISTNVINKHLLPVYSNIDGSTPMIFYPINTLIKSGIKEILIITSDESAGLIIETLGDGKMFGHDINFTYKIQNMHDKNNPIGIASALKLAEDFTKTDKFAVILGDNFFENSFQFQFDEFEKQNIYKSYIFLKEVEDSQRFGVAEVNEKFEVLQLEEKPEMPKSNYASTGLYLFDNSVYEKAKSLRMSKRQELEIVDIHNNYIKNKECKACLISDFWHDMGIPKSMIETIFYVNKINYSIVKNK